MLRRPNYSFASSFLIAFAILLPLLGGAGYLLGSYLDGNLNLW